MGRVFLEHLGGSRLFLCAICKAFLTNNSQLISTQFTSASGKAFLFDKVVNLVLGQIEHRLLTTGQHFVRDVSCKRCQSKVGWMYEYAVDQTQTYKEGHFVLEKARIVLDYGLDETPTPSMHYSSESVNDTD